MDELVDLIYEAAVVPEQWPVVLDRLARLADADAGILFTDGLQKWVASPGAHDIVRDFIAQGWPTRSRRTARLFDLGSRHPGFISDLDVFTPEEIEREPIYAEFLRPNGLGWGAGTIIAAPSGDVVAVDIERRHSRGPIERDIVRRLDGLRPHLARAALLASRLFLERVKSAAVALDLVGLAAAVLGPRGKPLAANARFEALSPQIVTERRERIAIVNLGADALLVEALAHIGPAGDGGGGRSIPVPATDAHPPLIFHLVPVRGAAHDVFDGAQTILMATPLRAGAAPAAELLQGLFDLTPAEARVARAIAQRRAIEAMAADFGVSRETVRTQVKAVLAKTGFSRQSDLAIALAGTGRLG